MEERIGHDALEDALKRCGSTWDAAQSHGLLSGRLAIAGADSGFEWLSQVLEGTDPANALRAECSAAEPRTWSSPSSTTSSGR